MKRTLRYALLLASITSLPALAHVTYTGRNFGTFDSTYATSTLTDQAVPGNYGWIDGTDSDYGDSHKLRAYRFTLTEPTTVTLSFKEATSQVTDFRGNVFTSQLGLIPGFSLYQGLAHLAPEPSDHDFGALSLANRPAYTEGSFRALTDWSIGNDPGNLNGVTIPASLSFFKFIGNAYDGTGYGSDGTLDHMVSKTFSNLAAGDYSVFVGGADYLAQSLQNPDLNVQYGITGTLAAGVVPEPETYAMLLAGLSLMGVMVRRRISG
ncbi:FxDxF family PEP-CTERM protein [Nitrosovibrio tenuis]|uniref:PEP-CTERM protein-sorting domain-containing protein n=1 Tax=Nitrosovibrio tenuis TaxID=1233 RepID=A0A1H7I6Q3_9PROT|nr:FxDxF family PEP-CTERM protein [Nitrosovibrio tenuis]SEK57502.1 PEP-CTERM protein-sorting domain-containing protein [Nitrosovibrio tenuis]